MLSAQGVPVAAGLTSRRLLLPRCAPAPPREQPGLAGRAHAGHDLTRRLCQRVDNRLLRSPPHTDPRPHQGRGVNVAPPLSLLRPAPAPPPRGGASPRARPRPRPREGGAPPLTCQLAGPSCLPHVLKALDPDRLHMGNQAGTFNHVWRLTQTHLAAQNIPEAKPPKHTDPPEAPGGLPPLALPPAGPCRFLYLREGGPAGPML